MEPEEIPIFTKFMKNVSPILKDENLVKLVRKRYHKSNPNYVWSSEFASLLESTEKNITKDPKHRFVYFKNLVGELKAYENRNAPKHLFQQKRKNHDDNEDTACETQSKKLCQENSKSASSNDRKQHVLLTHKIHDVKPDSPSRLVKFSKIVTQHKSAITHGVASKNDAKVSHRVSQNVLATTHQKRDEVILETEKIKRNVATKHTNSHATNSKSHEQSVIQKQSVVTKEPNGLSTQLVKKSQDPTYIVMANIAKEAVLKTGTPRVQFHHKKIKSPQSCAVIDLTDESDIKVTSSQPSGQDVNRSTAKKPELKNSETILPELRKTTNQNVGHRVVTEAEKNTSLSGNSAVGKLIACAPKGLTFGELTMANANKKSSVLKTSNLKESSPTCTSSTHIDNTDSNSEVEIISQSLPPGGASRFISFPKKGVTIPSVDTKGLDLGVKSDKKRAKLDAVVENLNKIKAINRTQHSVVHNSSMIKEQFHSVMTLPHGEPLVVTENIQGEEDMSSTDPDDSVTIVEIKPPLEVASSHIKRPVEAASSHIKPPVEFASSHIKTPVEVASSHIKPPVEVASSHIKPPVEVASSHIKPPVEVASSHIKPLVEVASSHNTVQPPKEKLVASGTLERPVPSQGARKKDVASEVKVQPPKQEAVEDGKSEKIVRFREQEVIACTSTEVAVESPRGDEDEGAGTSADCQPTKEKSMGSQRQIQRLEALLEKTSKAIQELEERELTLDDLDSDESAYVMEEKLQKRFVVIWEKLCKVKGRKATTGRATEKKFRFTGTRYPEINHKIEKFVNKKQIFPDFADVLKIVRRTNLQFSLGLVHSHVQDVAREAFTDLGNALQKRRVTDLVDNFGGRLAANYKERNDPAWFDRDLKKKLDGHKEEATFKMNQVFSKFIEKQYQQQESNSGDDKEEADDDDDDDDNKKDVDDGDESQDSIVDDDEDKVAEELETLTKKVVDGSRRGQKQDEDIAMQTSSAPPSPEQVVRLDSDDTVSTTDDTAGPKAIEKPILYDKYSTPKWAKMGQGDGAISPNKKLPKLRTVNYTKKTVESPVVTDDDYAISSSNLPVTDDSNTYVILSDSD